MYQKLSPTVLIGAIQRQIEEKTGLRCYDYVEPNTPSPFYFAELIKTTPANTKTMYVDKYTVWIHAIAEAGKDAGGSVKVYDLINKLQEAMTEDITLPEQFDMVMQTDGGIQTIKTDESGEKHAVITYEFMICYGFKCK